MRNLATMSFADRQSHFQNLEPVQGKAAAKGAPIYIVKKEQADTVRKVGIERTAHFGIEETNPTEKKKNNAIPARGYHNIAGANSKAELRREASHMDNYSALLNNFNKKIESEKQPTHKVFINKFAKFFHVTDHDIRAPIIKKTNLALKCIEQSPISKMVQKSHYRPHNLTRSDVIKETMSNKTKEELLTYRQAITELLPNTITKYNSKDITMVQKLIETDTALSNKLFDELKDNF